MPVYIYRMALCHSLLFLKIYGRVYINFTAWSTYRSRLPSHPIHHCSQTLHHTSRLCGYTSYRQDKQTGSHYTGVYSVHLKTGNNVRGYKNEPYTDMMLTRYEQLHVVYMYMYMFM